MAEQNTTQQQAQSAQAAQLTAREFFAVLFLHKWTILLAFAIMLGAILWGLSLRERVYVASVKYYVNRSLQQQASLRYVGFLEWEEEINSLAEMGRSQGVLTSTAYEYDQLRGWPDPPLWRQQEIAAGLATFVEVLPVPETDILNILVRDADADTAIIIADIYGRAFVEEFKRVSRHSTGKEFFTKMIGELEGKINKANENKIKLQSDNELYSWEHEIGALTESQQIHRRDLVSKRVEREVLEKQISLEEKFFDDPDSFVLTSNLQANKMVDQVEYAINRLTFELVGLESQFTPEHRLVKAKRKQLEMTQLELYKEIEYAIMEHRQRLEELKSGETYLQSEIDRIGKRLSEIPAGAAQMEYYKFYLTSHWRLYGELIQKYNDSVASDEQTLLDKELVQLGAPNIGGLEGETPKAVSYVVAPIFALLLAISIAFMAEATNHSFQKSAEIEEYSGLPVLATFERI